MYKTWPQNQNMFMNRLLPVLILLCIGQSLSAQYVYTIKADSVKITNTCDTAELILENHTQNVPGFLYNKGKGRTEFRRAAVKLNDSTYVFGADTVYFPQLHANNGTSVANGNVVLGNDAGGSAATLSNTREIPLNGHNVVFTGNGKIGVGTNNPRDLIEVGTAISGDSASVRFTNTNEPDRYSNVIWNRFSGDPFTHYMGFSLTQAGNTITPLRLAANSKIYFTGDVGVNVAGAPRAPLDLVNTSTFTDANMIALGAADHFHYHAIKASFQGEAPDQNKIQFFLHNGDDTASLPYINPLNLLGNGNSVFNGNIVMTQANDQISLSGGLIGGNAYGSEVYFRNAQGYGMVFLSNATSINSPGLIAIGSQASATNEFHFGRQDVSPTTARTFALFRGPDPSPNTLFTPTSGTAKFIEIGGYSSSGAGYATFQPSSGNATYTSLSVNDYVSQGGTATGSVSMLDLNMGGTITGSLYGIRVLNTNAQNGFGVAAPTARVHIEAGSANAGTAPLKLSAGTVLSTPEDGAVEYDGTNYYVTQSSTRYTLAKILTGQLTTNFGGSSLSAFGFVTASLTVQGAAVGDVVNVSANSGSVNPPSISITAFVISANTVTLQAYNASNSTVTIASDTYKVRVIK